jgi:methyltransferase (TIGR00027 family)
VVKNADKIAPEPTAARVALWRARHVELDAVPHILTDDVGLKLVAPPGDWRRRPDMHAERTKPFRASIVARARFVEDLVTEQLRQGVRQYVILGAGLDSFAQRHPDALASGLKLFEVDQAGPQTWKRQRLQELGLDIPAGLHLVPVNFEAGEDWLDAIGKAGFDKGKPAVVASTGVSMYLTKEATGATLRRASGLATGSSFVMSFMLPIELADPGIRQGLEQSAKGARASGTPWISFFTPDEIVGRAKEAGFAQARHMSAAEWMELYFSGRTDGLKPAQAEELLIATT